MYTFEPPILYPEVILRGIRLRSAPKLNEFKLFVLESTVPLGFCCGGFSSTAGYVPGNEARVPKDSSRRPSGLRKTKHSTNSLAHRTTWLRSDLLRSAPKMNEFKLFVLESTVPLGFCCGGFSSTAGYVPGNEARVPKVLNKVEVSIEVIYYLRNKSSNIDRIC